MSNESTVQVSDPMNERHDDVISFTGGSKLYTNTPPGWMWIPKIAVRGSDAGVLGRGCSGKNGGTDSEGDVRSPQSVGHGWRNLSSTFDMHRMDSK